MRPQSKAESPGKRANKNNWVKNFNLHKDARSDFLSFEHQRVGAGGLHPLQDLEGAIGDRQREVELLLRDQLHDLKFQTRCFLIRSLMEKSVGSQLTDRIKIQIIGEEK